MSMKKDRNGKKGINSNGDRTFAPHIMPSIHINRRHKFSGLSKEFERSYSKKDQEVYV